MLGLVEQKVKCEAFFDSLSYSRITGSAGTLRRSVCGRSRHREAFDHFADRADFLRLWAGGSELQIGIDVQKLRGVLVSLPVNVGKHEVGVRQARFAKESFARAFFRLVQAIHREERNSKEKVSVGGVGIRFQ